MFSAIDIGNRNGSWSTTATCERRLFSCRSRRSMAVDGDAAAPRIVEARHQAGERALAGAGGADDRHGLPGPDLEGHVVEDRPSGLVAEGHVLDAQVAGQPAGIRRAGPIVHLAPGLEDLEHAPGAAGGALRGRRGVHQRLERAVERGQVGEEHQDAADGEPAVEHALRAQPDDRGGAAGGAQPDQHLELDADAGRGVAWRRTISSVAATNARSAAASWPKACTAGRAVSVRSTTS